MASAYEMAAAMFRAGLGLTRPGLVAALAGMPPGPTAAPLAYSPADHGGARGAYLGVVRGGILVPMARALVTDAAPAGPVTPWTYPLQPAPPGGIPPA